ncbi:MAG: pyrroloquinoline quinone precursor peptide PqqA [Gammaproteobacteria bacterium]|nr:pyrroloquinoline quinone precursor peptide PqqA [Gammaproteobacteria bacterium]
MMFRFPVRAPLGEDGSRRAARPGAFTVNDRSEELVMKWETPQAIDLRFGMEITMYIAHR